MYFCTSEMSKEQSILILGDNVTTHKKGEIMDTKIKKEQTINQLKRKREEESFAPLQNKKSSDGKTSQKPDLQSTNKPLDDMILLGGRDSVRPMEFIQVKQETDKGQMFLNKINKFQDQSIQNSCSKDSPVRPIIPTGKQIKILKMKGNAFKVLPKTSLIQTVNNKYTIKIPQTKPISTNKILDEPYVNLTPHTLYKKNTGENLRPPSLETICKPNDPPSNAKEPHYNAKEDQAIYSLSNFLNRKYLAADTVDFFTVLRKTELGDKNIAKIVSDHIVGRSEKSVKDRLVNVIYKDKFLYSKPTLLFEMVLEYRTQKSWNAEKVKGLTKMITIFTQNTMIVLKCKDANGPSCKDHHPAVSIKMHHDPNSDFGIDENMLYKFLQENVPKHLKMPKSVKDLKILMQKSRVSFHVKSQCHILNSQCAGTDDHLCSLNVDTERSKISLSPAQIQHFVRIVQGNKKEGKDRCWTTIYELLCLSSSFPFDPSDEDMCEILKKYYITELDPSLTEKKVAIEAPFCLEEDKQLAILLRCLGTWNMVAKHLPGKEAVDMENRANTSKDYGQVWNQYLKEGILSFALMIIPKNKPHQLSLNCLVVGTRREIYLYPCKETGQFCDHSNLTLKTFIFDAEESDEQFSNFIKLTYSIELVKKGLVKESYSYENLNYKGDGIHAVMKKYCNFGVPKDGALKKTIVEQKVVTVQASSNHRHTGVALYPCQKCQIPFVQKLTRDRHMHKQHNICPASMHDVCTAKMYHPMKTNSQYAHNKTYTKDKSSKVKEEIEVEEVSVKEDSIVKEEIEPEKDANTEEKMVCIPDIKLENCSVEEIYSEGIDIKPKINPDNSIKIHQDFYSDFGIISLTQMEEASVKNEMIIKEEIVIKPDNDFKTEVDK